MLSIICAVLGGLLGLSVFGRGQKPKRKLSMVLLGTGVGFSAGIVFSLLLLDASSVKVGNYYVYEKLNLVQTYGSDAKEPNFLTSDSENYYLLIKGVDGEVIPMKIPINESRGSGLPLIKTRVYEKSGISYGVMRKTRINTARPAWVYSWVAPKKLLSDGDGYIYGDNTIIVPRGSISVGPAGKNIPQD